MSAIVATLAIVTSVGAVAQERAPAENQTLTGCLNPAPQQGSFQLTVIEDDGKAGKKILVSGNAQELTQHAKNHTVKLTGTMSVDGGKDVFKVSRIEHIDEVCAAATE